MLIIEKIKLATLVAYKVGVYTKPLYVKSSSYKLKTEYKLVLTCGDCIEQFATKAAARLFAKKQGITIVQ